MKILYWLRRIGRQLRRRSVPFQTEHVLDVPDHLQPNRLYLVGDQRRPWVTVFLCPSGCGAAIELNLLPEARPCWRVLQSWDTTVTLTPSIDRMVGCRSHFWVRKGLIEWA